MANKIIFKHDFYHVGDEKSAINKLKDGSLDVGEIKIIKYKNKDK